MDRRPPPPPSPGIPGEGVGVAGGGGVYAWADISYEGRSVSGGGERACDRLVAGSARAGVAGAGHFGDWRACTSADRVHSPVEGHARIRSAARDARVVDL